jgi:hypothetical protein
MTVAVLCLLLVAVGAFRCGTYLRKGRGSNPPEPSRHTAVVVLVNEGDCAWSVLFSAKEVAEEPLRLRLKAGETQPVTIAEGVYWVEQRLVGAAGRARHFEMIFEGGKKYRWRLVNLLSSDEKELESPPQERSAHE